jgi:hypothetical protein
VVASVLNVYEKTLRAKLGDFISDFFVTKSRKRPGSFCMFNSHAYKVSIGINFNINVFTVLDVNSIKAVSVSKKYLIFILCILFFNRDWIFNRTFNPFIPDLFPVRSVSRIIEVLCSFQLDKFRRKLLLFLPLESVNVGKILMSSGFSFIKN